MIKVKKRAHSIQGKLIFYFITLVFIITAFSGVIQYKYNSDKLFEVTREESIKLASAAALLVEGDDHEKLKTPQDQKSVIYKQFCNKMLSFKEETGITYIYIYISKKWK